MGLNKEAIMIEYDEVEVADWNAEALEGDRQYEEMLDLWLTKSDRSVSFGNWMQERAKRYPYGQPHEVRRW